MLGNEYFPDLNSHNMNTSFGSDVSVRYASGEDHCMLVLRVFSWLLRDSPYLKILKILCSGNPYTLRNLAKAVGVSPRTLHKYLNDLEEVGIIAIKHNPKLYIIEITGNQVLRRSICDLVRSIDSE